MSTAGCELVDSTFNFDRLFLVLVVDSLGSALVLVVEGDGFVFACVAVVDEGLVFVCALVGPVGECRLIAHSRTAP